MTTTSVPQISVNQVKLALDNKEDIVLLDVRTAGEYGRGKIADSINLSVDRVKDEVADVIPDHNREIYVYCLSGSRSDIAVPIMIELGYTNVYSMTHGLLEWRAKKYPLAF